ncbi:MAG: 2-C-methyl-D-erythritol 2,4-cyclodiphosphate synthase [Myxococcota bacterium]
MPDAPQGPRIGLGWDQHRLVPGRPLMLAGVRVPSSSGLLGHSDGDVACHAVADALLGAAGLGDIGLHFPSGARRTRGIAGLRLLRRVRTLLGGRAILGVDAVIVCETPRLGARVPAMRKALARALRVDASRVSVKIKSPEGLGALGRGEGIAAQAVALLAATRPQRGKRERNG